MKTIVEYLNEEHIRYELYNSNCARIFNTYQYINMNELRKLCSKNKVEMHAGFGCFVIETI